MSESTPEQIDALISQIEDRLKTTVPGSRTRTALIEALSKAAEAKRMDSAHRDELVRDARRLLKHAWAPE